MHAGPAGDLALGAPARLRRSGRVEVPAFANFAHDGVKVFAAPDLAYVAGGVLHVIDWKTGREDDTQPTQVLLQMWWALETYPELEGHGAPRLPRSTWPRAARTRSRRPADFREQAAETVRAGVAQMRALLADPERNIPLEVSAFERRESGLCRSCNFGPICEQS